MPHAGRGGAALSVGCWPSPRSAKGTSARPPMRLTFGHDSGMFMLLVHPRVVASRVWVAAVRVCCVAWPCVGAVGG